MGRAGKMEDRENSKSETSKPRMKDEIPRTKRREDPVYRKYLNFPCIRFEFRTWNFVLHSRLRISFFEFLRSFILYLLSSILFLPGCGTAVDTGQNTALDSTDLIAMTDQMSASILDNAAVQNAIAQRGSLKVVVEPVTNEMSAEVLPVGAADAFTARLRTLLSHHAPDKFTWILNLRAFNKLRNQELEGVVPGPSPEEISPEYALTATFTSMANESETARSDYYVCTFSLQNIQDRTVLWIGKYEVKKRAVKGFLD
jgi:hypothetical protein